MTHQYIMVSETSLPFQFDHMCFMFATVSVVIHLQLINVGFAFLIYSYKGHVPTMKFDYGETYGNHTAKYFQDYRSKTLESSKSNYCKGGYFPTYYTHDPDLVIGNRTRTRDRWLSAQRYTLNNLDYDRREELINFDKVPPY